MQFKDVIGQIPVKRQLAEMVYQSRLSHALLFLGREGSGGLSLAISFAQFIVCEKVNGRYAAPLASSLFSEETATHPAVKYDDSCGTCTGCLKMRQLVHPDVHFSYPVIPKKPGEKPISTDYIVQWRQFILENPYGNVYDWLQSIDAENRQGNITAEECNDIMRKINLKSFESEFKVLILWMPEYLGKEGNKLLKLIEEPPPNTLFILVAETESMILPTIVSRTQLVKVPPLETAEVEEALKTMEKVPVEKARQIASVSEGNYREAVQILQNVSEDWQVLLRDWLNTIIKTGPVAQVKWIEEMSRMGREKQKQFLRYFNHLLQQAIRVRIMGEANGLPQSRLLTMPENEMDFANRLNNLTDISGLKAIIDEIDKAVFYIERNANPKMLFHALTIKLYHIIANKSLILAT